jgi:two-component system sensor histidine kinase AlgZ
MPAAATAQLTANARFVVIVLAAGVSGSLLMLALQWPVALAMLVAAPVAACGAPFWFSATYLCRAMPIARAPITRVMVATLGAAGVTGAIWAAAGFGVWHLLQRGTFGRVDVAPFDVGTRQTALVLLAALGFLGHLLSAALAYLTHAFQESTAAAQRVLASEVAHRDAELRALRAQVDPHFLFNSLNSISGLTTADPARARQMCQLLSEFLRESMAVGASMRIPLAREIALAEQYLKVEQVRFGARLTVSANVSAESAPVTVPPLILQPLVENAVRHGIATCLDGGTIEINARRTGDRAMVDVRNPKDEDSHRPGTGRGLDLVRRRLSATYGTRATVAIESGPTWYQVTLSVPVEAEPA